jgi:hypothetical protein
MFHVGVVVVDVEVVFVNTNPPKLFWNEPPITPEFEADELELATLEPNVLPEIPEDPATPARLPPVTKIGLIEPELEDPEFTEVVVVVVTGETKVWMLLDPDDPVPKTPDPPVPVP